MRLSMLELISMRAVLFRIAVACDTQLAIADLRFAMREVVLGLMAEQLAPPSGTLDPAAMTLLIRAGPGNNVKLSSGMTPTPRLQ